MLVAEEEKDKAVNIATTLLEVEVTVAKDIRGVFVGWPSLRVQLDLDSDSRLLPFFALLLQTLGHRPRGLSYCRVLDTSYRGMTLPT